MCYLVSHLLMPRLSVFGYLLIHSYIYSITPIILFNFDVTLNSLFNMCGTCLPITLDKEPFHLTLSLLSCLASKHTIPICWKPSLGGEKWLLSLKFQPIFYQGMGRIFHFILTSRRENGRKILDRHWPPLKRKVFFFLQIHHSKFNMVVGVDHALFKGVGPLLSLLLCVCQG